MPRTSQEEEDHEDWNQHRMFVIKTLEDLTEGYKDLAKEVIAVRIKMAGIAAISGGITTLVVEGIRYFTDRH